MKLSEFDNYLFFAGQHWNHTWERQHELVTRFSSELNKSNIQVISPTGLVNHTPFSISFWKRIVNHVKSQKASDNNPVQKNMKMMDVKYIPFHNNFIGQLNYRIIKRQIKFSDNVFFWSTYMNPTLYEFFRRSKFKVYDLAERRSSNPKLSCEIKELERKAVSEADIVFVDNHATYIDYKDLNDNIYYIPQGVNTSAFYPIDNPERKYIGYIGNLHFAIDYDFFENLIKLNKDEAFLIIGNIMEEQAHRLLRYSNVQHIEGMPKNELNKYMAKMKIGLIPYLLNDVTVGVYPTKLFEYLASGVPVVSTPLPEVKQYSNPSYLKISSEPIKLSDLSFDKSGIHDIVIDNTWDNRWQMYIEKINSCLKSL